MRVLVQFTSPRQPFNAGEKAGFSPERAAELCDVMRVAKRIDFIPENEEDTKRVQGMRDKLAEQQRARESTTTTAADVQDVDDDEGSSSDAAGTEEEETQTGRTPRGRKRH